jgi:hypothetical protein
MPSPCCWLALEVISPPLDLLSMSSLYRCAIVFGGRLFRYSYAHFSWDRSVVMFAIFVSSCGSSEPSLMFLDEIGSSMIFSFLV